jgi:hypothetical protein
MGTVAGFATMGGGCLGCNDGCKSDCDGMGRGIGGGGAIVNGTGARCCPTAGAAKTMGAGAGVSDVCTKCCIGAPCCGTDWPNV